MHILANEFSSLRSSFLPYSDRGLNGFSTLIHWTGARTPSRFRCVDGLSLTHRHVLSILFARAFQSLVGRLARPAPRPTSPSASSSPAKTPSATVDRTARSSRTWRASSCRTPRRARGSATASANRRRTRCRSSCPRRTSG